MGGNLAFGIWVAHEDFHSALLYQWPQHICHPFDGNRQRVFAEDIPAQFFHEERLEVEGTQVLLYPVSVRRDTRCRVRRHLRCRFPSTNDVWCVHHTGNPSRCKAEGWHKYGGLTETTSYHS